MTVGNAKPGLLPLTLATALGLVAGAFWTTLRAEERGGEERHASAVDGARLAALEQRLASLEETLERVARGLELRAAAPSGPAPVDTRTPVEEAPAAGSDAAAPEAVLQALAHLERVVAAEAARTRAALGKARGGPAVDAELLERIRSSDAEVDWDAWAPVLALWARDPALAREEVDLLTAAQVLERFGPPTDVWSHEPVGTTWQYARGRDALDESWGTEIILRLPEGYVTQMVVRGRDW